jgi:signal transduction histidine kinase
MSACSVEAVGGSWTRRAIEVIALVAFVAVVVGLAMALLRPPSSERLELVWVLTLPAAVAVAAVPLLRRWVMQRRSVAGAALAVGLCSLAIGAIGSTAASEAMFLTGHDFRLFLVMAVLSAGIALYVGSQLSRPLAADVRRLGSVATAGADGDLTVRTGVHRRDEVGATAAAVDRMIAQLAAAEADRERLAEARRDLLTGVGHDLRTPLAAMRSAVESLQDGVAPDPERYLSVLAAQIDTVSGLVEQLFVYARLEAGERPTDLSRVSVAELADEAAEALAPVADRRHVKIDLHADGAAFVHGSPSGLSRVLRNLLDNAVRHAPAESVVALAITTPPGHVDVRVVDHGAGFPAEFRARAFEPFTRADPARTADGQAGLGLAITKAIVDGHGGTITLGDGPGGDVRVRLPASTGSTT